MTKWLKPSVHRAWIFSVLIAGLVGCDGSDNGPPISTFDAAPTSVAVDDSKVPPVPVVGTVTAVPGIDEPPVTTGGEPTPATALPSIERVPRFSEIAPDTMGGATYKASPAYEYDLGNLVALASGDSSGFSNSTTFITPIKGWVRYPEEALEGTAVIDRFPVIVFQHGNHAAKDPSYQGYDYLAKDLAEHGYVVISINANATNSGGDPRAFGDQSSQSRAQLILGTLDRLRQIDGFGQIDLGGNLGKLDPLRGKLDLYRVGIMGHSRGGQGVANAIKFNKTRRGTTEEDLRAALTGRPTDFATNFPDLAAAVTPAVAATTTTPAIPASLDEPKFKAALLKYNVSFAAGSGAVPPYDFKGAFMLAPTDFAGITGVDYVPLANLLPSCDGDVSNLQGARTYDHNRFGPEGDTTPRYQILVRGANHNFYNTIWSDRDMGAEDQRRGGLFIINSFMRYHVGGEEKFAAYWNSLAQLPKAACPIRLVPPSPTCDERMVLTVQKDATHSKLIQRFDDAGTINLNKLGGTIAFSGFDQYVRYGMASGAGISGDVPAPLAGFGDIRSLTDHVELTWSNPDASIVTDLAGTSATDYDSLTFRIAVVDPVGQEVLVTLTDSAGKSATVTASDYTDALYNAARPKGDGRPMVDHPDDAPYVGDQMLKLLNMVAIPLKAFNGVDMTSLKELKLSFPKEWGKAAITDIELQNLGRPDSKQTAALQ